MHYTSCVGVQHGNTHSHNRIYKLCGSPAWKHTFTQDIQALWESSMETYIHTGYTSSVGVQHLNTHSHKRIHKLCGSPAWKHTFTQQHKQALCESSMETHIHTRGYTGSVRDQYGNTQSFRPTGTPVVTWYVGCIRHS